MEKRSCGRVNQPFQTVSNRVEVMIPQLPCRCPPTVRRPQFGGRPERLLPEICGKNTSPWSRVNVSFYKRHDAQNFAEYHENSCRWLSGLIGSDTSRDPCGLRGFQKPGFSEKTGFLAPSRNFKTGVIGVYTSCDLCRLAGLFIRKARGNPIS